MKKVLVLAGLSNNDRATPYDKYFSQHIEGYDFQQVHLDQLYIEVSPEKFEILISANDEPIKNFDLVMVREYSGNFLDLTFAIAKYLKANKVRFFNTNYLIYRPVSKVAQAVLLYEQKVNFPSTYYSLHAETLIKKAQPLGYPLILKDRLGMHGSNNYLVKSETEALNVLKANSDIKFIAQQYLPNSHDYRVLVMGDQEPLQIKRTAATGSHLNNTSQGGKGSLVKDLPTETLADSKRLAKAFSIDIGGVDVLQSESDGQYYFLEVNNQPQIATGAEIPAKMKLFKDYLDNSI